MTILPRYLLLGMVLPAIVVVPYWSWHRDSPTPRPSPTPIVYATPVPTPTPVPIPSSDPAAAPEGKMTPCQKKAYWLERSFTYIGRVDHNYDINLALYWQKECNK